MALNTGCSVLCRGAVRLMDSNVAEEHTASIFMVDVCGVVRY